MLAPGTSQTTLSLMTDENATCRYATTPGVSYGSMANTFSSTGDTVHSTLVTGLVNGSNYSYYVRCQDTAGNANPDDFVITFWVSWSATQEHFLRGRVPTIGERDVGHGGIVDRYKKNNGAYSTGSASAARMVNPVVGPDQFAEITYDHDPGSTGWPGVMTRVQGPANGSGYLAIAYAGQVLLYRTDDNGSLSFTLLASANADVSVAPRLPAAGIARNQPSRLFQWCAANQLHRQQQCVHHRPAGHCRFCFRYDPLLLRGRSSACRQCGVEGSRLGCWRLERARRL